MGKRIKFTLEFWPEGDQVVGRCKELGVTSCSSSLVDAIRATADAVATYLDATARLMLRAEEGNDAAKER